MIITSERILNGINNNLIFIEPFSSDQLNPTSYDLRLGNHMLKIEKDSGCSEIHLQREMIGGKEVSYFEIEPGDLYLGVTMERFGSNFYLPFIDGKSSLARLGITVHICASFGEVGFINNWTLEITTINKIKLYVGMLICQVRFAMVEGFSKKYEGKFSKPTDKAICVDYRELILNQLDNL